ncbi:MAG: addiction module toxin RelE [Candidatus ainarchaeum sp.]|nr:addiction module toxin RelE [Candidatus ainarchaeum sp.]
MSFNYSFSNLFENNLSIIYKKDKLLYESVFKKINEIISIDEITIDFYKNLRYDLKEYKRVHVLKSFVIIFKVFKKEKFILFERVDHHDNVYK